MVSSGLAKYALTSGSGKDNLFLGAGELRLLKWAFAWNEHIHLEHSCPMDDIKTGFLLDLIQQSFPRQYKNPFSSADNKWLSMLLLHFSNNIDILIVRTMPYIVLASEPPIKYWMLSFSKT